MKCVKFTQRVFATPAAIPVMVFAWMYAGVATAADGTEDRSAKDQPA